ncbi:MAG: glycosyltransferase [Alistipes sp.]|nr:glycosyltransferase [Alistipes sp.]
MVLISIIVPVYNTEKYLDRCIQSILAQTYTDFELLLVDDGSTDSSGAICDKYAAEDSRVKVFHKENGGVSSARNFGLDKARGEWIGWVDSDDYIAPNMYKHLLNAAITENADIAYCDYADIDGDLISKIEYPESDNGKVEFISNYFRMPISALWVTLVKTSLYVNNIIKFPEENYYGEDFLVTSKLYLLSKKNTHVKKFLYTHCYRSGESLMAVYSYSQCMMMLENLKEFNAFIKNEDFYLEIKPNIATKILEAKAFLLYHEKEVMNWYNMETWTHKYIHNCDSIHYGAKRKLIEIGVAMCCNIINRLLDIRI